MRLAFITSTIHDEVLLPRLVHFGVFDLTVLHTVLDIFFLKAYSDVLERARDSFESGQLYALYDKNSPELQPLKSGFACFKCARSFARVETSKVHCRSCGRLFCGMFKTSLFALVCNCRLNHAYIG